MEPIEIVLLFLALVLAFKRPSQGNLPFLVKAEVDEWIRFEVETDTVIETKNDKEWNCYAAKFRKIRQDGNVLAEDGGHEIPFWAMGEFYATVGALDGWQSIRARVSKSVDGIRTVEMRRDD